METNKCATCKHWNPKKAGEMAKHRFAPCALGPNWAYKSPMHTCQRHIPASDAVSAARVLWLEKSLHVQQKVGE